MLLSVGSGSGVGAVLKVGWFGGGERARGRLWAILCAAPADLIIRN